MGLERIKQISLIWVAISLTALSRSQNIPNIINLGCLNDFDEKMFCFWEIVGKSSNCSEDFTLTYTDFLGKKENCPDLRNEQLGDSVVPNKCICNTALHAFVILDTYEIEVKSHGHPVGNTKIEIKSTVKPRAPSNVRVGFEKEQNGVVQWKTGYEEKFMQSMLSFHIQILFKHNREVVKEEFFSRVETRYSFSKRQLKRGEDYVVRVRTKAAEVHGFEENWSEWSPDVEWRNDYSLTIMDLKNIIIPTTCIVMLCLITISYVCLIRYKKKWWNNIPDPAKSKLVQSNLLQKQPLNSDGKPARNSSCFFSRIVKVHKSKCDQLIQHHDAKNYVNISRSYEYKKAIFKPEDEDIERCVKIYPKEQNENTVEEDQPEHKAKDLLDGDLSIAKMFFDILCDSSDIKVDTFGNFNTRTSFACSVWIDNFGKKETQPCNSDVSAYGESGYNSYGSDDSPLDFLSEIDELNMLYFSQWPDIEKDSISCTQTIRWEGNLKSPGYNSFANALSDAKKNYVIDTSNTFCLDSLSNKNNCHKKLLTPKSILYYNTKCFFSHNKDSYQSIISPNPEKVSEITLQCQERENDPNSICHVFEYQRFDQAVQEIEPEFGCQTSGHKRFAQAVHEGGPDSGCQGSGYQSFDQEHQQGDMTSACQPSGYQSFDQAVQQRKTPGSNCHVVELGYKPLNDLNSPNVGYSVKYVPENGRQYQLGDNHYQNNTESLKTEEFINIRENGDNKTINRQTHEPLSSSLTKHWLEDIVNLTKEKYDPCKDFSDNSFEALKIAVDAYLDNNLAVTHEIVPFVLTFDICKHLRNLDSLHGHRVSLNSLMFPCHLDEVQFIKEQLTSDKYLTSQKSPTRQLDTFENLSYFVPLCDFEELGSSQPTKPFLVKQSNVDKDGNSYMKLALP